MYSYTSLMWSRRLVDSRIYQFWNVAGELRRHQMDAAIIETFLE